MKDAPFRYNKLRSANTSISHKQTEPLCPTSPETYLITNERVLGLINTTIGAHVSGVFMLHPIAVAQAC